MSTSNVKAVLFDTFGSVVDWRASLIDDLGGWGAARGLAVDWPGLVDAWRGAYAPSMDQVRKGELPWTILDALHRASLDRLAPQYGLVGRSEAEMDHVNRGWHRLRPWSDALPGLLRLKARFIIGPLSNGNVSLLLNMAKFSTIPWDVIFGSDVFGHFKPDAETYLGAAAMLGLEPGQVMMAAAHNHDLHAAQALGLKTAFFARPTEYGPLQVRDFVADGAWDVVANDIEDLATQLGA